MVFFLPADTLISPRAAPEPRTHVSAALEVKVQEGVRGVGTDQEGVRQGHRLCGSLLWLSRACKLSQEARRQGYSKPSEHAVLEASVVWSRLRGFGSCTKHSTQNSAQSPTMEFPSPPHPLPSTSTPLMPPVFYGVAQSHYGCDTEQTSYKQRGYPDL